MTMKYPPHPGRGIRQNCLEPLDLNVTAAAKVLDVARHTLSRVLNGHAGVSPASRACSWWDFFPRLKPEAIVCLAPLGASPGGFTPRLTWWRNIA